MEYMIKEISRSFSKTIQLNEYEPIQSFCSITAECDEKTVEEVSKSIYQLCKAIVELEIEEARVDKNKPKEIKPFD
jgi:hypothetical protein